MTESGRPADPLRRRTLLPLVVIGGLFLAACGQGSATGETENTAGPTSDDTLSSSLASYTGIPIGGRFEDAEHGAVVRAKCAADGCGYQVLTTSDGGKTWSTADVPGPPVTSTPLDDAYAVVLPGGQIVTEIQVDADRPARRTADGGKTWAPQKAAPVGVTTSVAGNEALVGWCAQSVDCAEPLLRVIRPNGTSASFGPPPAQLTETISASRVPEGALWVQGRDGVGRVVLAVSRDNGKSWTLNRVPAAAASTVSIAGAGDAAWALSLSDPDTGGAGGTVPTEPGRKTRQSLLYSADSARTFNPVKLPEDYRLNTGSGVGVTDSGAAVIASDGRVAVVTPDGDVTDVPDVQGAVYDLGDKVLVYGPKASWVTSDGTTWNQLPALT
ncbi:hypothetical protein [Cryptosporangium phraense]|uniref:Exo-alpha-sialidase n=1 Tax=Cryptosporangium phraense TaxID=2593070 RepID=A0A545AUE3_9ACTN|nr:hypothetical protein [Cryptosporangium phraense]TQS44957.1 hypothetical protein FL583_10630 [Cryptosporangium phraense]